MDISGIGVADIVQVSKRDRIFLAEVRAKAKGELAIKPLKGENVNYFTATSREVVGHWKKRYPR